jgi:predicted unusual protein kinase regulating ubiquinone biosynthesis (AarF/ABC1/UbiB family)
MVLQLVANVIEGMQELHRFGLAHCDIHRGNVVFVEERRVFCLIDLENGWELTSTLETADYRAVGRLLLHYMAEVDADVGLRALYLSLARGRLEDLRRLFVVVGWEVRVGL